MRRVVKANIPGYRSRSRDAAWFRSARFRARQTQGPAPSKQPRTESNGMSVFRSYIRSSPANRCHVAKDLSIDQSVLLGLGSVDATQCIRFRLSALGALSCRAEPAKARLHTAALRFVSPTPRNYRLIAPPTNTVCGNANPYGVANGCAFSRTVASILLWRSRGSASRSPQSQKPRRT